MVGNCLLGLVFLKITEVAQILSRVARWFEQMVAYFSFQNPNFDIFWKALELNILKYFMTIWYILGH
jgi:hypothetical protein